MALQMSYTDDAGNVHENSYWVISDIDIFKKLHNTEDMLRKSLDLKDGERPEQKAPKKDTTKGYFCHITVCGFKSSEDRDNNGKPIAVCYYYPTKHPTWFHHTDKKEIRELDHFEWDTNSNDSMYQQMYAYLKTLDFWSEAVDAN